ncbi:hypothetical protein JCM11491_002975 [Sporobolomyces phaffii]
MTSPRSPASSSKRTRPVSSLLSDAIDTPTVESLASLLIRSVLVLFLLLTSLLLALVAWFSLRSFLRVDPIIGRERVWLQYGEYRTPYAFVELPKGKYEAPGASYDLSLELTVPSSPQNLAIGNFMVSINLLSNDFSPIVNTSRPAILTHPAYPKFSHLLPLRPIPPPSQRLSLPLLEGVALNRSGAGWSARKRVESIQIEVGRKDAHPESALLQHFGAGGGPTAPTARVGGELQVYESWLTIRVKLYGLRALIRSHPYISFLFFFPTFLLTEFLAALAVYAYFVFRPEPDSEPTLAPGPAKRMAKEDEDEEGESDVVGKELDRELLDVKDESEAQEEENELLTSEPPSVVATESDEGEEAKWESERRRARREREVGPGGVGMTEVGGDTETEPETSETGVSEEDEEGTGSEEWAAVEGEGEGRVVDKDFDETATVGGSETTRASRSTFGPSVAGTTSTRTTATSSRPSEGLRERQGRLDDDA